MSSESDVPTAEKSSPQLGNLLIPWAQAGLFSDCPTPISESLKGLQLTLDNILPRIPPPHPHHLFQPGDAVLVHCFQNDWLEP